jgi:6-pyruvoyltetrahydropterin/6-carboxytetrahydropterin synthase
MFRLQVQHHFDAAHRIRDYVGKCNREHGHRWQVEVCVEGEELDHRNILIDFGEVKRALKHLLDDVLDHNQLNEILEEPNVTAEFLCKWIWDEFSKSMENVTTVQLVRVCVWESPECCVKYSPRKLTYLSEIEEQLKEELSWEPPQQNRIELKESTHCSSSQGEFQKKNLSQ